MEDRLVAALVDAGLGLDYDALRLERTTDAWLSAGSMLRDRVASLLAGAVSGVEPVGSASVPGLLAKPIIDLAIGLGEGQSIDPVIARLEADGWIHRGDAGQAGGQVFVLEARPWHRVAHAHGVAFGGDQWRNYLRLRDILRHSPAARRRYASMKLILAEQIPVDRRAYTAGKGDVVATLLRGEE